MSAINSVNNKLVEVRWMRDQLASTTQSPWPGPMSAVTVTRHSPIGLSVCCHFCSVLFFVLVLNRDPTHNFYVHY